MMAFLFRRFRWVLLGAGVKYVARRTVSRSVDEAASQIEDRLPMPVANVMQVLPGDVVRAGGVAVVSARAAQRGAVVAQRGAIAAQRSARVGGAVVTRVSRAGVAHRPRPAVADRIREVCTAVSEQAERDSREYRADFRRFLYGGGVAGERAAVDALLDRRTPVHDEPLPIVPEPVGRGRRRSAPESSRPEVARVQRSYRRPPKAWDRRLRRGPGPESSVVS